MSAAQGGPRPAIRSIDEHGSGGHAFWMVGATGSHASDPDSDAPQTRVTCPDCGASFFVPLGAAPATESVSSLAATQTLPAEPPSSSPQQAVGSLAWRLRHGSLRGRPVQLLLAFVGILLVSHVQIGSAAPGSQAAQNPAGPSGSPEAVIRATSDSFERSVEQGWGRVGGRDLAGVGWAGLQCREWRRQHPARHGRNVAVRIRAERAVDER